MMKNITIRELTLEDKEAFLKAMLNSQSLHHPWVTPPLTSQEFDEYWQRLQQANQKSYLTCDESGTIVGVFNVSEIVQGAFQNAFIGFYGINDYTGKGYMSAGLKLVQKRIFEELALHRLEANIQPENTGSIQLVKNNGFRYEGFSPRYLKINGEWRGHEHWAMTSEDYLRDNSDILKKDYVDIVPYNSDWPKLAQSEIDKLKSVFPANTIIDIQHVGSTAISGLSAKPILDIQIAVQSLEIMKLIAVPILQKLGYEYWDNNPDPKRMFFVKGMPPYGEKRTHHVHIFEHDSAHWCNKLIFRDYLRSHRDIAKEYEQLKVTLAQEHLYDREKYTDEKLSFVNRVLQMVNNTNQ
ncbi:MULTISPECIES: GNAT family N-acetyltransferase [unclassified Legionella]|uniref:GNAT family N-acetyltransferase n=1 Tax=unclassified Legionella TaxID=2622702 RepID=UPI001F5E58A4|nr:MULTISPECIES: GNAT family N-acetyltransferase [unclassified Legionella]MDI9819700.1 GNAT family N-acetyltransferase [Legionella sp. PL877]